MKGSGWDPLHSLLQVPVVLVGRAWVVMGGAESGTGLGSFTRWSFHPGLVLMALQHQTVLDGSPQCPGEDLERGPPLPALEPLARAVRTPVAVALAAREL